MESDEEGEILPNCVTNYYFVNSKEEPVSFSTLPLQWNDTTDTEQTLETDKHLFLRGMIDDVRQQIYKKVIAWKFELSYVFPELHALVCGSNKRWINLQKPRKSYEDVVRTVLISVHCLHYIKRNPEEVSKEALWKHIRKAFSTYEVPPSATDLVENLQWIKEAASRDKDIRIAKNLDVLLFEMSRDRKSFSEENRQGKNLNFIVEEVPPQDNPDDGSDQNKDELFDRVCALCDDGGDILGCEGRCIRSFHMTVESGDLSSCESLCYSRTEVEAIQTFLCKNCRYQQHQCFICGRLGSSDRSSGAEVFPCVSATCGYFYHPKCVAELVFPNNDAEAQDFHKQIEQGDSFVCPGHKCSVCKQGENKDDPKLLFAVCRRCPKAYHRKCLPRNILFEADEEKGIPQRAWNGLLNKRILIYCMDHKIYRNILTPKRDHLLFPEVRRNKQGVNSVSETRSKPFGLLTKSNKVEKHSKGSNDDLKNEKCGLSEKVSKPNLCSNMTVPKNIGLFNQGMPNKLPKMEKSKLLQQKNDQSVSTLSMKRAAEVDVPTGDTRRLENAEMQNRIKRLMKSSNSSFNFEEFVDQQRKKIGHSNSSNFRLDKTITMGKVECSVKAVEAALNIIQKGGSIEDAKAVCEPGVLTEMMKWKKRLAVYLAPFLHGKRYTSFGRHFTNVEKLKQVIDRLCWYVEDGDTVRTLYPLYVVASLLQNSVSFTYSISVDSATYNLQSHIVDFSCGSNDFSCLMKEKLDSMGRQCYFKNYDLIQPKNDFNYEKRDWMSIKLEELPEGSSLIMGLNPPFGAQAFLANQFIDKALTFSPKLLILIVPKETESLEKKKTPYDLIWEDDQILSGKSFYLPGSIDVNDQQLEQWNVEAPPLYLWSRPDWTTRHRAVAVQQGHVVGPKMEYPAQNSPDGVSNYLMEDQNDCFGDFSSVAQEYEDDIIRMLEDI